MPSRLLSIALSASSLLVRPLPVLVVGVAWGRRTNILSCENGRGMINFMWNLDFVWLSRPYPYKYVVNVVTTLGRSRSLIPCVANTPTSTGSHSTSGRFADQSPTTFAATVRRRDNRNRIRRPSLRQDGSGRGLCLRWNDLRRHRSWRGSGVIGHIAGRGCLDGLRKEETHIRTVANCH